MVQVSRHGWDEYAGSRFVVELQRSREPEPGSPSERRRRLARLIGDVQREQIRGLQNAVIKSLLRPPSSYAAFNVSPEVTRLNLGKFEEEIKPYAQDADIWLRYADPAHVKRWGTLLAEYIPMLVQAIEGEA